MFLQFSHEFSGHIIGVIVIGYVLGISLSGGSVVLMFLVSLSQRLYVLLQEL